MYNEKMNRLKELREEKGLLQKDLAKILNVQKSTIGHWETGHSKINIIYLQQLADYFNVTTDYLLGFEPSNEQNSVINEVYEFAQEIGITNDTIKNMTPQRKAELQQIINILCNKTQDK